MTHTGTDRHSEERALARKRVTGRAAGSRLRWTLGAMWFCIATALIVRLLTGSEGWGALALLGSAVVAYAVLPSSPPRG